MLLFASYRVLWRILWNRHYVFRYVMTHQVPSTFLGPQTVYLDSEDPNDEGSGLVAHFIVHVTANTDGSFAATMDHLSLRCGK